MCFTSKCENEAFRLATLRAYSRARECVKSGIRFVTRRSALRFTAQFVKANHPVFDVGANVGIKTALYVAPGARVVAAEPQEKCVRMLTRRFARTPQVEIVHAALGSHPGEGLLRAGPVRSPLSSMSEEWIAAVKKSGRFSQHEWGVPVTVAMTTLDELILRYGLPDFCKIDVEGYEIEVLRGLSRPIPALSFEFHIERRSDALDCLRYLQELGDYEFNLALGNRRRLECDVWKSADETAESLQFFSQSTLQGDVYAMLRSSAKSPPG